MNDADLLYKYGSHNNSRGYITGMMDMLSTTSVDNLFDNTNIIDIAMFRAQVNEFLTYCSTVKRFNELKNLFDGKLQFVPFHSPHFLIEEHIFHNLDEVEKCWNNKALL